MRDDDLQTASDEETFDRAAAEDRVLVSDADSATLLAARSADRPSVIPFRHSTERRPEQQTTLLLANLATVAEGLDEGGVVVFERQQIRIRRLPFST